MMIKNWTVITKQIKKKEKLKKDGKFTGKIRKSSAIKYYNYLINDKAKSHLKTNIIDLNNSSIRLAEIENEFIRRKLDRMEKGLRGGGLNCEATSFVLSLPKDVRQPTHDQWRIIAVRIISELEKSTGISGKNLWKQSVVVLHEEPSKSKKSHLNIMIGNVHNNDFCKKLTQYSSTNIVKKIFNREMLKLGVDHKKYMPQLTDTGHKPLYLARLDNIERKENKLFNQSNKVKKEKKQLDLSKSEAEKLLYSFKKWVEFLNRNLLNETIDEAKNVIFSMNNLEKKEPELIKKLEEEAKIIEDHYVNIRKVLDDEKIFKKRRRKRII